MTRSPGGFCCRGLFLPVHSFVLPFLRKRTSELPTTLICAHTFCRTSTEKGEGELHKATPQM